MIRQMSRAFSRRVPLSLGEVEGVSRTPPTPPSEEENPNQRSLRRGKEQMILMTSENPPSFRRPRTVNATTRWKERIKARAFELAMGVMAEAPILRVRV